MQAGQLRDRITIQRKTAGTDAWGAPLPDAWEDYTTVWANVRHLSGTESIKAGADVSVVRASIRIRWREGVDAGQRVLIGSAIYQIQAVMPDLGGREYVDMVCQVVN